MIKDHKEIPEFQIKGDISEINESFDFHSRNVELIEQNLNGGPKETILCYFITEDGRRLVAELPEESYLTSINESLRYFVGKEEYEMCGKINKVKEKLLN